MKLGFVSAILPDLDLAQIVEFAANAGFDCVELMCWPVGKGDRRYAGVTHIDVLNLTERTASKIGATMHGGGIEISGLGFYPNLLSDDKEQAGRAAEHLRRVIAAARMLKIGVVNTFVGRDPNLSVEANWARFLDTWVPIVAYAEEAGVKIGIENCPMLYTTDEWPGGKNLAVSPAIWRRMFTEIPSPNFGLNYDPSHLVWQQMDYVLPLREFAGRLHHVHAKDARVDRVRLNDVGIVATPLEYHTPKLPGLGDIDWGKFFSALMDARYDGPVCVEVEDRAYEGNLDLRKRALRQSCSYLRNYIG